ncbi:ocs element-binding factor 1-like protein [Carex littledalei]|uniref:Ocs element-binding factor 1-like protein n=1 Tax=Carex littledalei TaxID=544730 RepID=A0A833QEL4_9POAL|nr:ocs element-binding factor 1-like protein [Carex littledalei]
MSRSPPIRRDSSPEQDSLGSDERKRKRMQSNRDSARRSRLKKQHHLDTLISEAASLKTDNADMEARMNLTTQQYLMVEKENQILRARHAELAERLRSLNSILRIYEEFTGVSMDIPEMPDSQPVPVTKPWQLPVLDPIMTGFMPEPDYPVTADPLLNPWQVPAVPSIMAASNLVRF